MKKLFSFVICLLSLGIFGAEDISAQQSVEYHRGTVTNIIDEGEEEFFGDTKLYQAFDVQLQNGDSFTSKSGDWALQSRDQFVTAGDRVLVQQTKEQYRVIDHFRLGPLGVLFVLFVIVILLISRRQGVFSLLGLFISIYLIAQWLIPGMLSGQNIVLMSVFGGTIISSLSLYLSHGVSKQTTISLISILIVLALAFGFASSFVWWGKLFGLGTEESFYVQLATSQTFDLRGLFLGGVIIGTIGVLDDVTTTQVAVVQSLRMENAALGIKQLFSRAMSVGRTHIASLVNTLALAYTGAALPLFLLFHINEGQPWWVILNSEFVAEEIVRTLSGSIALVLAVPISTYLAAIILSRWPSKELNVTACACAHKHK